jgi:hypothetical protein
LHASAWAVMIPCVVGSWMLDVNEPYFILENLGIKGTRYIELEKLYNNEMIKNLQFSIICQENCVRCVGCLGIQFLGAWQVLSF